MTKKATFAAVALAMLSATSVSAFLAVFYPTKLPDRLFAAGLLMVPFWALFVFAGVALPTARMRAAAFVFVNAACWAMLGLHWGGVL